MKALVGKRRGFDDESDGWEERLFSEGVPLGDVDDDEIDEVEPDEDFEDDPDDLVEEDDDEIDLEDLDL